MITRRRFLEMGALSVKTSRWANVRTAEKSGTELGAQTNAWAIDPTRFDSFLGVLDQIKRVGYAGFETGFFNLKPQFKSPEAARDAIAKTGLTFFGIHIAIPFERNDPATHLPPAAPLYAETDPSLVSFLLDAGHAYRGGADVPALVRKHYHRIVALHLHDYRNGQQVPLGEGTFPLAEVAATLKRLDWKGWALNEEEREDGSKHGLDVIKPAFQALQKAFP
jgi:sugar phosphate isomerase/epimerase